MGVACASNRVIFVYEVWAVKTVDFSGPPKGPKQISQGNALGAETTNSRSPKGRNKERTEVLPPLCLPSGLKSQMLSSQGLAAYAAPLCPGLSCYAPSGQETKQTLPSPPYQFPMSAPTLQHPSLALPVAGSQNHASPFRVNAHGTAYLLPRAQREPSWFRPGGRAADFPFRRNSVFRSAKALSSPSTSSCVWLAFTWIRSKPLSTGTAG